MAKGLLDILLDKIFDEKFTGWYGEKLTEKELKFANLLGKKGKILRNVYLPKDNGETSEVDVIYITQKGIIVIESKNYSGWIFGDEKGQKWTVMLPNKQKNQFYNPILQNKTHIKWMKNTVGEDIPLFSVIVFSERCELKKVTVYSDDVKVIKRDRLYANIRDIWEKNPDTLTEERVEELYEQLKQYTKVGKDVKKEHIQNIKDKFEPKSQDTASTTEYSETVETEDSAKLVENNEPTVNEEPIPKEKTCPKCGNPLILRTAKRGENAGKQFYGCSNYPKCRYIENL
ncbi:MAG TPA: DNA-binding protein [Lachnospiraceae bacterium]|nr:DNA-binding protein [Lachnospiraceae bacterium]